MTREFIITREFDSVWKSLGLNDDDLNELEIFLCKNPDAGDTMKGTGGARVIYLDIVFASHIYLITAFPKNVKPNLSKEECNQMKTLVTAIKAAEKEAQNEGK